LQADLGHQLKILRLSCQNYDDGHEFAGIIISTTLRVLLHDNGRNSKALLEQLNIRASKRFYDSAGSLNPRNLLPEIPLVMTEWTGNSVRSVPVLADAPPHRPIKTKSFHEWWTGPVLRDRSRRTMSRMDLVTNVADTDGGAHVDPGLEEVYHGISRKRTLEAVQFFDESGQVELSNRIELACLRQIAFETILSIERHAPQFKE
jgi:hypothetical protein